MAREIRFRVWDKLDKCYKTLAGASFGDYNSKFCGFKHVQLYAPKGMKYDWQARGEEPIGFEALNGGCSDYKMTDSSDSDRLVFEQATGITDDNGKEIYEGDILHSKVGIDYVVSYSVDKGKYEMWSKDGFGGGIADVQYIKEFNIEVIGNIHEEKQRQT